MAASPIAGTGVFLLGGLAAAVYLLPFRGVRGWAYETGWLVSVLAGWLAFPLIFDAFVLPDFWGVMGAAAPATLLRSFGFGVLWGGLATQFAWVGWKWRSGRVENAPFPLFHHYTFPLSCSTFFFRFLSGS